MTNWWSAKIVCVSSEVATFVERTERPRTRLIAVIPNGVPVPLVGRRDPDDRVVLRFGTLGTVKPIKGTDLLVDAFMKFPSDAPVQLTIAGLIDRPWAESLRDRAAVDRRITFVGRAVDPVTFLRGLDVFVLPSRSEGMSNALLEAMALGLPCLATDVGSNGSVLTPEHAPPGGIVCAATAEALFSSMDEMLRDAAARCRYGDAASDIVRAHYSTETMVNRYRHLYAQLISTARGNAARTMPRLSSES
jgi:glycosyltransferase involved in cell wall biosynthesis